MTVTRHFSRKEYESLQSLHLRLDQFCKYHRYLENAGYNASIRVEVKCGELPAIDLTDLITLKFRGVDEMLMGEIRNLQKLISNLGVEPPIYPEPQLCPRTLRQDLAASIVDAQERQQADPLAR